MTFFLFFLLVGFGGAGLIWFFRPQCGYCESRVGHRYTHSRIDGGPDRRYHNNPLICINCGRKWSVRHATILDNKPQEFSSRSCHYMCLPGVRLFKDCPDYPNVMGEKCRLCWIKNEPLVEPKVSGCHFIFRLPGGNLMQDCPDYPKKAGEKCEKCKVLRTMD